MRASRLNPGDLVAAVLLTIVFVLDVFTPRGVASGMPYVLPVLATMWSSSRWSTVWVATVCGALTLVGFFVSSDGTSVGLAVSNRTIAVVTIVAVAAVCIARLSVREALEAANQNLKRSNAALEQEIALRTRIELNLLRSNRELEQYAYVAAHDLTAPLRHVVSFLSLLERNYGRSLDQQAHDYIVSASRASKRMQELIDDLLKFSQLDSRKEPFTQVDFNVAFEQVVALLEPAITESRAAVTCDLLPTVMGVESQLVQVLQNLIGNALKYRSKQPPQIHVRATRRDGQWEICVSDNGIGVDPKHADEIFKIFRRLHTIDEYPGTGIGLALCQRIVERHDGRIWLAASEPGDGSMFCFTLPVGTPTSNCVAA